MVIHQIGLSINDDTGTGGLGALHPGCLPLREREEVTFLKILVRICGSLIMKRVP
jgi:hypothetical protein